jgi:hypothetical protein
MGFDVKSYFELPYGAEYGLSLVTFGNYPIVLKRVD